VLPVIEEEDIKSLNSQEKNEEEMRLKREMMEEAEIEEPMEQVELEGGHDEESCPYFEGGDGD
jgi:hypothetical protein